MVGFWAQLPPRSIYGAVPRPSHRWIAPTGACTKHLVGEVGAGAAWSMFSVPQLVFHATHGDGFGVAAARGLLLLRPAEQTQQMDGTWRRASFESTR